MKQFVRSFCCFSFSSFYSQLAYTVTQYPISYNKYLLNLNKRIFVSISTLKRYGNASILFDLRKFGRSFHSISVKENCRTIITRKCDTATVQKLQRIIRKHSLYSFLHLLTLSQICISLFVFCLLLTPLLLLQLTLFPSISSIFSSLSVSHSFFLKLSPSLPFFPSFSPISFLSLKLSFLVHPPTLEIFFPGFTTILTRIFYSTRWYLSTL